MNLELPKKNVEYLIGDPSFDIRDSSIFSPFSDLVIEFLNTFSKKILKEKKYRIYPDIITLGYWCRNGNIKFLKKKYLNVENRKGKGIAFHITPSNVPVNFAYSYIFSLLSGNINIVRVPTREFDQASIIINIIDNILNENKFLKIKNSTFFVKYLSSENNITSEFFKISDLRLLWGSNKTIKNLRNIYSHPRSFEIIFSERYSISVMNSSEILKLNDKELVQLVKGFYNDTFLMDQNACSSPQTIFWYSNNLKDTNIAKNKFWDAFYKYSKLNYDFLDIFSVDKLTDLCSNLINNHNYNYNDISVMDNLIYRIELENVKNNHVTKLTGKLGIFHEVNINELSMLTNSINNEVQTLTYYGLEKEILKKAILESNKNGIDRIVPVGQALDIGLIWDGYDLIYSLSRIINTN